MINSEKHMNEINEKMGIIIQQFRYGTHSEIPSLWASMGYTYGKCARQLHYNNKTGKVGFTPKEMQMMESGTKIHEIIEKYLKKIWIDFNIENEVKRSFDIVLPDGSLFVIGAKPDLLVTLSLESSANARYERESSEKEIQKILIEIKYIYSRSAYYQTLIEKLVFPETRVMCFQYGNLNKPAFAKNILIPLKADYDMSVVYAGRIITALYNLPPRFPNAHANHPVCNKCIHKEECYQDLTDYSIANQHDMWNDFKRLSQIYIDSVRAYASKPHQ